VAALVLGEPLLRRKVGLPNVEAGVVGIQLGVGGLEPLEPLDLVVELDDVDVVGHLGILNVMNSTIDDWTINLFE